MKNKNLKLGYKGTFN